MAQLRAGSLSAFRLEDLDGLEALALRLPEKMNGKVPDNVVAIRARDLRAIKINNARALCVLNDTRTDTEGSNDPEHIALSPCERFNALGEDDREEIVLEIRNQIILAYRADSVALHPVAA